jgi:hypothetical protein
MILPTVLESWPTISDGFADLSRACEAFSTSDDHRRFLAIDF